MVLLFLTILNTSFTGFLNGPTNIYSGIMVVIVKVNSNVSVANTSSSANVTNFQQAGLIANVASSSVVMAGVSISGSWIFVQNIC